MTEFERLYRMDSSQYAFYVEVDAAVRNRLEREYFWLDSLYGANASNYKISKLVSRMKAERPEIRDENYKEKAFVYMLELRDTSLKFKCLNVWFEEENVLSLSRRQDMEYIRLDSLLQRYPQIARARALGLIRFARVLVNGINVQTLPESALKPVEMNNQNASSKKIQEDNKFWLEQLSKILKNEILMKQGYTLSGYLDYEKSKNIVKPFQQVQYRENFYKFLQTKLME
ncbi:MAG: hypothetical protein MUF42_08530 [Cytophagaceae bacterium]|nr:hypothetical protein [Cytophagaceae bacterium]